MSRRWVQFRGYGLATTLFVSHPSSLDHDNGLGHPERADRIRVQRVHPAEYVASIRAAAPTEGLIDFAEDVVISPGTWLALSHSVGGVVAAVNEVMRGLSKNAFVAMRPGEAPAR
jgi:acetoin utilization deacetylase AcuC-like enzyme